MGEPRTHAQRIGLTRGKGVTIGVLAVALAAVMYIQFGGGNGDKTQPASADAARLRRPSPAERRRRAEAIAPDAEAAADTPRQLAAVFTPNNWKSPDLSQVVTYDPFALPPSFPQPLQLQMDPRLAQGVDPNAPAASADADELATAIEQMRMQLEELQQRGVQVIVRGRDKYVAMIGDRMVHVGDVINGFTVTAIEPDGVRVERNVDP